MNKNSKIYIAGHQGLVGSAIINYLNNNGYTNILYKTHSELDLTDQLKTFNFFKDVKPEYVVLAAAKVGGIHANNTYPAKFIYENLQIQNNVIHSSYLTNVKKLLFLGSVCVYPKYAKTPVTENSLLSGELEPTNEPYAIAKIAGIKMCQSYRKQYGVNYISCMPCNLYGENDNFHGKNSHVIPALIKKIHKAKIDDSPKIICWGDGTPRREFLDSRDVANASVYLLNNYNSDELINIGFGVDYSISEIVNMLCDIIGYEGKIVWDTSMPNGTPSRLLNSKKIMSLGWKPKIELKQGLENLYSWYINTI